MQLNGHHYHIDYTKSYNILFELFTHIHIEQLQVQNVLVLKKEIVYAYSVTNNLYQRDRHFFPSNLLKEKKS